MSNAHLDHDGEPTLKTYGNDAQREVARKIAATMQTTPPKPEVKVEPTKPTPAPAPTPAPPKDDVSVTVPNVEIKATGSFAK